MEPWSEQLCISNSIFFDFSILWVRRRVPLQGSLAHLSLGALQAVWQVAVAGGWQQGWIHRRDKCGGRAWIWTGVGEGAGTTFLLSVGGGDLGR